MTTNQLHLGQYFSIGNGKFDSRNRYIRAVANPADKTLNMCRGQSLAMNTTVGDAAGWTWSCNGVVVHSINSIAPPSGFNGGLNVAI